MPACTPVGTPSVLAAQLPDGQVVAPAGAAAAPPTARNEPATRVTPARVVAKQRLNMVDPPGVVGGGATNSRRRASCRDQATVMASRSVRRVTNRRDDRTSGVHSSRCLGDVRR